MLNGEYGEARAKALRMIIRVGESLGAEGLVRIRHAHVSGVSYLNIGEPGLKLLEELYNGGGRAAVYTTINPSCIDLTGKSRIIDNSVTGKQFMLNRVLEGMGFTPTYTCIPYLVRRPGVDEHLAWGESNAVVMANSYYGARTNREGGPLALAAALTGYTYYAGLHLPQNRVGRIRVRVGFNPIGEEYSMIGLWIGENVEKIPVVEFPSEPVYYGLKLLFAASAATGSHGLVVVKGVTPRGTYSVEVVDRVELERKELEKYRGEPHGRILAYIGCPHLHPGEVYMLLRMAEKHGRISSKHSFLISIPYIYKSMLRAEAETLRRMGFDVAYGTCPIVSRIRDGYDTVLTNSGKAWFYLQKLHGLNVVLTSVEEMMRYVMEE